MLQYGNEKYEFLDAYAGKIEEAQQQFSTEAQKWHLRSDGTVTFEPGSDYRNVEPMSTDDLRTVAAAVGVIKRGECCGGRAKFVASDTKNIPRTGLMDRKANGISPPIQECTVGVG